MIYSSLPVCRMPHKKFRVTKQQPSRAKSGHLLSCCLVFLLFLGEIISTSTVEHPNTSMVLINC